MHIDYPEHIYPDSLGVKVELNVWSKRAMLLGEERRRRDLFDQTGGLGSAGVVVSSDGVGGDVVVVAIPWRCCVGWDNRTQPPPPPSLCHTASAEKLPPPRCMRQATTTTSRNRRRQATGGGDDGSNDGGDDDNDGGGGGSESDGDGDHHRLRTPW